MSKRRDYGCIYKHTNLVHEGWSYIGQTMYTTGQRWKSDGSGYQKNYVFRRAIEKYGWDNFSHEIIEDNIPPEKLDEREKFWISFYHTYIGDPECKGYNMTEGGNVGRGRICREDTKQKTSETLKGHSVSDSVAKRVSECSKGRKHTPETIAKIAAANHGRDTSPQPIKCLETGIVYKSINEASKHFAKSKHWIENRIDNPDHFKNDIHFTKVNKPD